MKKMNREQRYQKERELFGERLDQLYNYLINNSARQQRYADKKRSKNATLEQTKNDKNGNS